MPAKPWVTVCRPDPEQEYLILLTELPLRRYRDIGAFLLYTWRIQGQLRRSPGVLGYALLAHVFQKEFWTLSVWEGEAALQRFVAEAPHSQVMRALQGKMGATRFVKWRMRGAELPPRWAEALARRDAV